MSPSRLRRAACLAALAALAAACGGADAWIDKLQADPLYRRAEKLRLNAPCSALVPMEFGQTLPVPARGGQRYSVLYYPVSVSPGKSEAMSPVYSGDFARGAGEPDRCEKLGGGPPHSVGAPVPAGLSQKAYYKAAVTVYAGLDKAAALYGAGGTVADADKKALADFADAFTALAEPGLKADYYRQNPDFWEWLRREAGRSIPKA